MGLSSDDFKIFDGSESHFLKQYNEKIAGLVSGSANAYPREFRRLLDNPDNLGAINRIVNLKKDIKSLSFNSVFNIKTILKQKNIIETNEMYE